MSKDNRRHKRFVVDGVESRMVFASETRILNLSISGAAIETDRRLNPGSEYTLKLEKGGASITLKGTIAWSVLSGTKKTLKGEMAPVYRAGMKFLDVMNEKTAQIIGFIESHKSVDESRLGGIRFNIEPAHEAKLDFPYSVSRLSLGGMQIESAECLSVEDTFQMEIFPGEEKAVRFTGRIVHCNARDDGKYDVGIEFLHMDDESRRRLMEYVQSLYKE